MSEITPKFFPLNFVMPLVFLTSVKMKNKEKGEECDSLKY